MPEPVRGPQGDLDQQIRAARRRLGESITATARLTPDHVMVWGQFADAPAAAAQTGIYGTSAAVALLAARGRDMAGTVRLLPGVTEPSAAQFDVSDLFITHKVSAIVEALSAVDYPRAGETPACLALLEGVIDGQGWGHHVVPGEPEAPSVLATAQALIALSGVDGIPGQRLTEPAEWLRSRVVEDGGLGVLELAFATIALARLRRAGVISEDGLAIRRGADILHGWLRRFHARPMVYEQVHYWVPKPGERRNHYMTFPLQVVVGIAVLVAGAPVRGWPQVTGLASRLCRAVRADGGLRSRLTERVGVVDAVLVDQFFAEYLAARRSSRGLRRSVGRWARARWLHRVLVFGILVAAALWSWPIAAGGGGMMSATALANIAFALVTGVLGSMAYSRWDRR